MAATVTSKSSNPNKIVLIFNSQEGRKKRYRYSRDRIMQHLFSLYCKENNMDYGAVRFLDHQGQRVTPSKTPSELGLKEDDVIDALMHQNGG